MTTVMQQSLWPDGSDRLATRFISRDGVEAIELARCQKPLYVLLDIGLPRLDGYEVASRLRQEQAGPLVIIAITGHCQENDRQQAMAVGCDYFFVKPVHPRTLISLLSGLRTTPDSSVQNRLPPEATRPSTPAARRDVHITNALGLHLRAADKFVRLAQEFQANVTVSHDGREVSGKSILDLATLALECGSHLVLNANGTDAEEAADALADLILRRFDEEE